jgi:crotonobetainyl-CoA:carnitine CoA-transferase CaiB-like acyl-CoA transferase
MGVESQFIDFDRPSTPSDAASARQFAAGIWEALGGTPEALDCLDFRGSGDLPSIFAVSDFAAGAVGAAGTAVSELIAMCFRERAAARVSRRLSSLWCGWSIRPHGWSLPTVWDPIAGDYATADGWIRLHTNAPHHRDAALAVLKVAASKEKVARAVARWNADDLEATIVERGGCAAAMRTIDAWRRHPQGRSVSAEPLVSVAVTDDSDAAAWAPARDRPLRGLRVLDLTRVLAGPVATRFLAAFGADVLRVDPPTWDEPGVVPEVTLGKRCARLDLRASAGRVRLRELLRDAHVLVHGYRADALEGLGLGTAVLHEIRPGLVEVSLDAYGWTGPWRNRRGFDSLVQMSTGIAERGMRMLGRDRPTPLPVQALDHATGYMMAAAAIRGVTSRLANSRGFLARASLARTAEHLMAGSAGKNVATLGSAEPSDELDDVEQTGSGPVYRLRPPLEVGGAPMRWERPAAALGSSAPSWQSVRSTRTPLGRRC